VVHEKAFPLKSALRPNLNAAISALIAHIADVVPEYGHIDAQRILIVAGEARRASRGTVKPLFFQGGQRIDFLGRRKPAVEIGGRRMRYIITLRPLFFRKATLRQRVTTILHELFHISPVFDGSLDLSRRHAKAGSSFDLQFRPVARRALRRIEPAFLRLLQYDGEVRVLQWLEKPQSWMPGEKLSHRLKYTEKHLFEGVMRMKTSKKET
jgi:hypothetical protein